VAAVAQAYAALYSGRARGVRLLFAAERGGPGVELDALRLAAEHAKQGEDTQFYAQVRPSRGLPCLSRAQKRRQPYLAPLQTSAADATGRPAAGD